MTDGQSGYSVNQINGALENYPKRIYKAQNAKHSITLASDNVYLITIIGALTQTAFPLEEIFFAQYGRASEGFKFVSIFKGNRFLVNKETDANVLNISTSIGSLVKVYKLS